MKKAIIWFTTITLIVIAFIGYKNITKKRNGVDKVTLRLNWAPSAEHAFVYLGMDKGFYKEKNIEVEALPSEGSMIAAKLVGNRSNDFGFTSGDLLVILRAKGVPLRAIATLYHECPSSVFSLKEKNITQPKDLIGKKVGVIIQSANFQQYQDMLKNAGIDRSKITEVPVSVNAQVQEILSGNIDASIHYTNYAPVQIRSLGKEVNEFRIKDFGIKIYSQSIVVNEAYIKEKPDLVQRFIDATLKSLEYSRTHPDEALNSLLKHNPELDRKLQELMLRRTNELIFDKETDKFGLGYMTIEGWKQTQETLKKIGLVDNTLDPNLFFDDTFWKSYNNDKEKQ